MINVSGHRLSTAEIESALVAHTAVAEAAVIAVTDEISGQAVIAYVTVVGEAEPGPDLATELRDDVGDADRQARPAEAHHLEPRTAQDPVRKYLRAGCCAPIGTNWKKV